jgi:hypothetical protein
VAIRQPGPASKIQCPVPAPNVPAPCGFFLEVAALVEVDAAAAGGEEQGDGGA